MIATVLLSVVVALSPALVHHPVSTAVAAAQQRFDEGLTMIYAFNRAEARKRFEAAAAADPKLAIAWWGVALAAGPNINEPMDAADLETARAALEKARTLERTATAEERALIGALSVRYPAHFGEDTDKPYRAYRDAMASVSAADPADDDAAVLYAESLMDTDALNHFTNGVPEPVTQKLIDVLAAVLAHDPYHVGAAHYWIHAWDRQGVAAHALPEAEYLRDLSFEPAASHLLHMPGHTFLDVGDFGGLIDVGRRSSMADDAYAKGLGINPFDVIYHRHNLDFWAGGALLAGDRAEIERALAAYVAGNDTAALLVDARIGDVSAIDAWPRPSDYGPAFGNWYFARGLAAVIRADLPAAVAAAAALDAWLKAHAIDAASNRPSELLHARIAHAAGDDVKAEALLRASLAHVADDPPEEASPWFYPAGEWLGDILLDGGHAAEAEEAFRADLVRTPNNPRVLYGLMQSLEAENRLDDARALAPRIAAIWRGDPALLRAAGL